MRLTENEDNIMQKYTTAQRASRRHGIRMC